LPCPLIALFFTAFHCSFDSFSSARQLTPVADAADAALLKILRRASVSIRCRCLSFRQMLLAAYLFSSLEAFRHATLFDDAALMPAPGC